MRSTDSFKELIHRVNDRLCIHGETFRVISFILLGELGLFCEELRVPACQRHSAIHKASESLSSIFNIMPSYRRIAWLDLGWNT